MKRYKVKCNYKRSGAPTYVLMISSSVGYWWDTPIFEPYIQHNLECIKQHISEMEFPKGLHGHAIYTQIVDRELRVFNRTLSTVILTITFEPING